MSRQIRISQAARYRREHASKNSPRLLCFDPRRLRIRAVTRRRDSRAYRGWRQASPPRRDSGLRRQCGVDHPRGQPHTLRSAADLRTDRRCFEPGRRTAAHELVPAHREVRMTAALESLHIVIGGLAIEVTSSDATFVEMLSQQYGEFVDSEARAAIRLDVDLTDEPVADADADVHVRWEAGYWK